MSTMADGSENQDETIVIDEEDTSEIIDETNSGDESNDVDDESGEDEVIVSIGEESPPQEEQSHAPEWVRELRKTNRELQRQNRELQGQLQTKGAESKPVSLGRKPSLEEHDYDADRFEAALADWFDRKRSYDDATAKHEAEVMTQQTAWQAKLDAYGKAKADLKVRDYEDAEEAIQHLFNITQQGVVLQGADNPALVVYALGKNPKKAKELADIKDPVKFAFAVAKLEKELKVTNRKAAPPPEKIVSGTGRVSGAVDSTLERLREEAARTGNMTKVVQYKQQKRAASK
jgi:hypothetical protein